MSMPEGAQLSEDGKYWWDGSDWQPVPEDGGGSTEVGQLSEDGQWKWDGSQWQPVDGGEGGGEGLQQALSAKGLELSAEHADAGYVEQMYEHVKGWYDSLGADDKAIFDALSEKGGDTILADPEVGVVNEGDPLIEAFAGTTNTLGQSLDATGQALEQAQA